MRLAIIGGGQLGMMLCTAASKLGIETRVLDPDYACSASNTCDELIVADFNDRKSIKKLAKDCDYLTYEFENIDIEALEELKTLPVKMVQGLKPLQISTDRFVEKEAARVSGFPPVSYKRVQSLASIEEFVREHGYPAIIKTRKLGYDGKGQVVINDPLDINSRQVQEIIKVGSIIEKAVDLDYELSVIIIRNKNGETRFIPSTINKHINNILFTSHIVENGVDERIIELVYNYIEYHNLKGIITIEVFICKDGDIYFNEMAPRPHNSGHYSIEGCNHSQFEMQLRAVCELELPMVKLLDESLMVNILGQDYEFAKAWVANNQDLNIYFHDYLKTAIKHNRKMAHITAIGIDAIIKLSGFAKTIKERNE